MIFPRIDLSHLPINPHGLVGYWSSLRGPVRPGGTVYDLSGRGNHGVCNGNALWIPGIGGIFNGYVDYVDVGTGVMNFTGSNEFTVSAWIKTGFYGSDNYILGTDISEGWYMRVDNDSGDKLFIKIDDGVDDASDTGDTTLNDKKWHHIIMINNGTDILGYVDGIEEINVSPSNVGNLCNDLEIGALKGRHFTGLIDEVMIFNKALNATQRKALYKSQRGGRL